MAWIIVIIAIIVVLLYLRHKGTASMSKNQPKPNGESIHIGCFVRHLQRRKENPLFKPERRIVTKEEIIEAQEKDQIDQRRFVKKVLSFMERFESMEDNILPPQAHSFLMEIQDLLEEAASIGGTIFVSAQDKFTTIEQTLIQYLKEAAPDTANKLEEVKWLSNLKRSPFSAQVARKDSPILKGEIIPALLSENLEIISLEGCLRRYYKSDPVLNEVNIKDHLEKAVTRGSISKDRADQIITAWSENQLTSK
jgi:anthranilate/para-aminobenzoate synthase component I